MFVSNRKTTKFGTYDGFSTHLLVGESNSGSKEISIQITDVEPNEMQFLHAHEQEQCYYIVSGSGLMIIDEMSREVEAGDAILVPSNALHGIKNIGQQNLTYLTANRPFGKQKEAAIWPEEQTLS